MKVVKILKDVKFIIDGDNLTIYHTTRTDIDYLNKKESISLGKFLIKYYPEILDKSKVDRKPFSIKRRLGHKIVQCKNPRTGHYVKINRELGMIISHKKSKGPYKNIPIAKRRYNEL